MKSRNAASSRLEALCCSFLAQFCPEQRTSRGCSSSKEFTNRSMLRHSSASTSALICYKVGAILDLQPDGHPSILISLPHSAQSCYRQICRNFSSNAPQGWNISSVPRSALFVIDRAAQESVRWCQAVEEPKYGRFFERLEQFWIATTARSFCGMTALDYAEAGRRGGSAISVLGKIFAISSDTGGPAPRVHVLGRRQL